MLLIPDAPVSALAAPVLAEPVLTTRCVECIPVGAAREDDALVGACSVDDFTTLVAVASAFAVGAVA